MLSFMTACNTKSDKDPLATILETTGFPPTPCADLSRPLDIVDKTDTLKIQIEATDCGEWGGHRENIFIQRNLKNKLFARFIMDTVPCDKIVEKGGAGVLDDKTRVIVLDTTKLLNFGEEKLISIFLQRLLELYLKNEVHSNSGTVYQVINTNSSLNFTYWNSGDCRDTYYAKVRKHIFGDILGIK